MSKHMGIEDDLVYPLIILGVGAGITAVLIPRFSRKYEEAQKRIDRDREDYKFELEIKEKILEKLTDLDSKTFNNFHKLSSETPTKESDRYYNYGEELVRIDNQIRDYLVLYFNSNKKLRTLWSKIYNMCSDGNYICSSKNSQEKNEAIKEFLKAYNITSNENYDSPPENEFEIPTPLFEIFKNITELKLEIKKSEVDSK